MKFALALSALAVISCPTVYSNEKSQSYLTQAQSCEEKNDHKKATELYELAIAADPNHFEPLFYYANFLYNTGDKERAIAQYLKSIVIRPTCAQVYYNLGICFAHTNNNERAIEYFKAAIAHNPNYTKACSQLGILLDQAGKGGEAAPYFEKVLAQEPNNFDAHYHLGNIYKHADKFTESLAHYREAIKINPNHIGVILELANTLNTVDQHPEECLQLYKKVLDMNPKHIPAKYNYGFTLKKLGYTHEAIREYNEVLELKPDYSLPHFSRGLAYLTLGDWERGWEGYQWRWKAYEESPKKFTQPLWDGSDPAGKTILIYAEQGLGDTMQFIRYAKVLHDQGARIIFQTQKPLVTLLSQCPYIDSLICSGETTQEPFDFQIPLLDFPYVMQTRIETVPVEIPYLYPDQELVAEWREKLAADTNIKIGICWQGNPNYSTQFLRQAVAAKSLHVKYFEPLAQIPGVSLYSLQKVSGTNQLADIEGRFVINDFGPDLDEKHGRFMDTAAIIPNLDLIVSVDTGTCHLAAALGAPTWVILPYPADWRWMLDIEDTPWYPTMRLFRQKKAGDWETVMRDVAQEVTKLVEAKKQGLPLPTQIKHTTPKHHNKPIVHTAHLHQQPAAQHVHTTTPTHNPSASHTTTAGTSRDPLALKTLITQFQETNAQLVALEQQLKTCDHSVFNTEFLDLTRKAYLLHNMHTYLKKQLSALTKA